MYATRKQKAIYIRNELKALGYNSRHISVKSRIAGYSDAIDISIKDLSINIREIDAIARECEEVRYDEYSGEILSGGNTYIHVNYDPKIICDKTDELRDYAKKMFTQAGHYIAIADDKNGRVLTLNKDESRLWFIDVNTDDQHCYHLMTNGEDLAYKLVQAIYIDKRISADALLNYSA